MKRHLLLLLLLVPLWAPAQTVDALFGKYKTAENAVYAIIPPETLTEHELYRGSKVTFAESLVLERGEDTIDAQTKVKDEYDYGKNVL